MYGKDVDGVSRPPLIDKSRRLVVAASGGRHAEAALAGRLFYAANQDNVVQCSTLHATFTGLAIVNPSTSGKNLIMHEFNWSVMDSPDVDSNLSLGVGNAHSGYTAGLTVMCTRKSYKSSVTIANVTATRTGHTAALVKHVGVIGTNLTTDLLIPGTVVDLGGQIIIEPGYAIFTDALLATNDVMLYGFMWEEVVV